jgi:hypothetical protein
MNSNDLIKKVSSANQPLKVRAVITASTDAAVVYYCKPSINGKLLLPKLTLLTNDANGSNPKITVSKTTITDPDLLPDTIQLATSPTITASDVSNSSVYEWTLPSAALTTTPFQPVASNGITDALLTVNPEATTSNAVKISIADVGTSGGMTGVLELEFLPI